MNPFELAERLYGRFFPKSIEEWPAKLAEWNRQPAEIRAFASVHLSYLVLDATRATLHAAATGAETSAAIAEGVDGVIAFLRALAPSEDAPPAAEQDASGVTPDVQLGATGDDLARATGDDQAHATGETSSAATGDDQAHATGETSSAATGDGSAGTRRSRKRKPAGGAATAGA